MKVIIENTCQTKLVLDQTIQTIWGNLFGQKILKKYV